MAKKNEIVKVELLANITHGTADGRVDYTLGQVIDLDIQVAEELATAKVIKILG